MLSVATLVYNALNNAPDLTQAIGKAYTCQLSEVWNLPNDVTYPILAIDFSGERVGPRGVGQERITLTCWYVTDTTKTECYTFADALKAKLDPETFSTLPGASPVFANEVRWLSTRVYRVPQTSHFQAHVQFTIVA